jgi:hypothetical protein
VRVAYRPGTNCSLEGKRQSIYYQSEKREVRKREWISTAIKKKKKKRKPTARRSMEIKQRITKAYNKESFFSGQCQLPTPPCLLHFCASSFLLHSCVPK